MSEKARNRDLLRDNALGFHVSRMIRVDLDKRPCGRKFLDAGIRAIMNRHKSYTSCYGCYVYSIRAGKGYTPIYVGSATKQTLGAEAFNSSNLLRILQYMGEYGKATLLITFVAPKDKIDPNTKTRRGNCPNKTIKKLEKVLTAVAYRKNRNLINKQNRGLQDFFIHGALTSNRGRPETAVGRFKDMMGLRDKCIVVVSTPKIGGGKEDRHHQEENE